jgi:hypothetical protein
MSEILSRFSQPNNSTRVDYTAFDKFIDQQKQAIVDNLQTDSAYPYTYAQWSKRNSGIIPNQEYQQYQQYILSWYSSRNINIQNNKNLIKNDYINLLKEISLTLKDESEIDRLWLNDIDWNDPEDLEEVVPFYARKLKEIAIYLINKRDAIKKSKLKYNMAGSTSALEKIFYEYLLKAFTKRNNVLNVNEASAWQLFPNLSSVNANFRVEIEELYDDTLYFDKDPSVPVSAYFDTQSSLVTAYFDTLNFSESAIDWLFSTGFTPLCANNPLLWTLTDLLCSYGTMDLSALPLSAFEASESMILNQYNQFALTQKYLGEKQYIISGGYFISKVVEFMGPSGGYNFIQGNNWFYWPSGEYLDEANLFNFDPILLTATNLVDSNATAGPNYLLADKIFVEQNNQISGAWLKLTVQETETHSMSCQMFGEQRFFFKFPYPGFGVSGEGLDWTGPQISNIDKDFEFLDDTIKDQIRTAYWTAISSPSSILPLLLFDSNLADLSATAGQFYDEADKITIRTTTNPDHVHDETPDNMYQNGTQHAWLYEMLKTDIPIKVGQNYIYWPLMRYNKDTGVFFTTPTSQCTNVKLSEVDINGLIGGKAGFGLADSDILYKLDASNGYSIECAWLSGVPINNLGGTTITANTTGIIQPSLSLKCIGGNYTTFIWCGDDNKNINNTTIVHKAHEADCLYLMLSTYKHYYSRPLSDFANDNPDNAEWKQCDCLAIPYSPLGHPGPTFEDYGQMADYIILAPSATNAVDLLSWRGTDNKDYKTSRDFAWFKLEGTQIEPEVGWGPGKWVNYNGVGNFRFRKGQQYKYFRNNLKYSAQQAAQGSVPYLIVREPYNNKVIWAKANLLDNGEWLEDTSPSDMIIKPGDYLLYDHIDSNWYCATANDTRGYSVTFETTASNPYQSIWSNYTYVTTGTNVTVAWPGVYTSNGPRKLFYELSSVRWFITKPNGSYDQFLLPAENQFNFVPDELGVYGIYAIGTVTENGTRLYELNIPAVAVVPLVQVTAPTGNYGVQTFYADTLNFALNIPLSGWDYNGIKGAKPFWGVALDDDSRATKYKATIKWGGGITVIDDYTFITQPDVSPISLDNGTYVDYYPLNNLNWIQPINFYINKIDKQWCKLDINPHTVSPLSAYLHNVNEDLIASASNEISRISLYSRNKDEIMFVNYWAQKPFTWIQSLTDSSVGLPPSGGLWNSILSGVLVNSISPYAYLTNRHFPTVASMPYVGNLLGEEEIGGYSLPKNLGASIFLSKNISNSLDTTELGSPLNLGVSGIYRDIDIYQEDRGFSEKTQITPISAIGYDANWMKAGITEANKSGLINNLKAHQEFLPYQTKYETTTHNDNGVIRQNDPLDPWYGEKDDTWENNKDWPPDFRHVDPIEDWYSSKINFTNRYIYQWKTDVYGHQFALIKPKDTIQSIYTQKSIPGNLYMRDMRNLIKDPLDVLSLFYANDYRSITAEGVKDFDIWFDTIMLQTSATIYIQKIIYSFDTNEFTITDDNLRKIPLSANRYGYFGGIWFFPETKHVTLCNVVSGYNGVIYPQLWDLNLNNQNIYNIIPDSFNDSSIKELTALSLSQIEEPVFSYNIDTRTYSLAFLGYSLSYVSPIISTIYIVDDDISKVIALTPNS